MSLRKPKLVSIVTPSYNQAEFIEETILSVKGQDYPNIEHIIIDGGSSDRTLKVLTKYQNKYNLRWISEPDNGQSEAINKGFHLALGDLIGWINSDDTYLPGAISTAVEALNSSMEIYWVHGNGYRIDENSFVTDEFPVKAFDFHDLIVYGMHMVQPSIFFRREILDSIGLIDPTIHTTLDYDFMLRMSRKYPGVFIPKFIATRRYHTAAKSVAHPGKFYQDYIRSLDKAFAESDLPPGIRKVEKRAYAHANLVGGINYFQEGDYKTAKQLLIKGLKLNSRPWEKGTIIILILLSEIELGIHLVTPGFSRRMAQRQIRLSQGYHYVGWKSRKE